MITLHGTALAIYAMFLDEYKTQLGRGLFCLVSGRVDRRGVVCGLKQDPPCVTLEATNEGTADALPV